MSDIDPKKLKVAELREELKQRGEDTKGNKNQLVKRLQAALAAESGADPVDESLQDESFLDTTTEETLDSEEPQSEPQVEAEAEPEQEPEVVVPEDEPITEDDPVAEEELAEIISDEGDEQEGQKEDENAPEENASEENAPEENAPEENVPEENDSEEQASEEKAAPDAAPEAMEGQEEADAEEGVPIEGEFQVMDSVGDTEGLDDDHDRRGEKRHRSRSRDRDRDRHGRHEQAPEPEEPEDWLQATNMQLDRFNCDLNIRIKEEGCKGNPITVEGFAFMWSGVRANFGVKSGKTAFEVKIVEELNADHLPPEETSRHVVRVGFSTDATSLQLGEEPFSYGYGGTAKASTDCKFKDFGETFGAGDVIGAYLDFESEPIEITYTKNGEDLGKCFDIEKDTLGDQALFPHVLTKNCEFECNFGEKEEPWFPLKEGFDWVNSVPVEDRVRGALPPGKKEECEILMMCGLPGAGKTVWSGKHAAENSDKKFFVLGTNNIIEKMKVMGLPRKKNYAGRWDVLIDKSTRCLNRLLEIAAKKKRNYILDQTNVYPSAQRRKMRPFEGFQRKAIVIVPTDEEYKIRCEKREKEEGKDVPDSAVLEMKANFALPEEGNLFDKVDYLELDKEEATKLVEKYNKEGRDALPPPDKRYRDNRYSGRDFGGRDNRFSGGFRGGRGGGGGGGNYSGGGRALERRGGGNYSDRNRGGSYMGYSQSDRRRMEDRGRDNRDRRGGRSSNNYQDNRNSNRSYSGQSNYNRSGSGNWGTGSNQGSWGNQGNWGSNQGSWGNQNQWGQNYQGSWGNQWSGYPSGQQSQGWGQNYNYNWPSQNNWSGYNQNQTSGSWGSNYNSGSGGSGSYQRK